MLAPHLLLCINDHLPQACASGRSPDLMPSVPQIRETCTTSLMLSLGHQRPFEVFLL